jgi:glucokinase
MAQSAGQMLLGDIGGTNARFALLVDGQVGSVETFLVSNYPGIAEAIDAFFARHYGRPPVTQAYLAIAGPVHGDRCVITNSGWLVDGPQLRKVFKLESLRLINDFEAIAWSLRHLRSSDVYALGSGQAVSDAPAVVLGPGTGLGMACFMPRSKAPIVVASEGGHSTLPSSCRQEDAVIDRLRERFGHVSAERVLSGAGLENLYRTMATIDGVNVPERRAADITKAAIEGICPISCAAVDMFCSLLGTIAGNLALTFAARGGVYIAGGIVPHIAKYAARSTFRDRFVAKGRFRDYLEAISTSVIIHPDPAFIGLKGLVGQGHEG